MATKKVQWLTTKDVCKLLGKTPMMIYLYRKGTLKTTTVMPYYTQEVGQRHRVLYKLNEILSWAKKNGLTVNDVEVSAP